MKKFIIIVALIACCLLRTADCFCQDIHLSQFYFSPLNVNPALTGAIEGELRGILNYRNQWRGFASPFVTMSFSADMTFLGDELGEDWVGAGLVILKDKAGTGNLTNLKFMLSGSYFKWINKWNYLSGGVQAGFVQRKLDYSQLTFNEQWDPNTGNLGPDNGEGINDTKSFSHLDVHTGLLWSFIPNDKVQVATGIGLFHLLAPPESFYDFVLNFEGQLDRLGRMVTIHSNAKLSLNKKWDIRPSALYMRQKKAQELTLGTSVGYKLVEDYKYDVSGTVFLGSWYRLGDALVMMIGGEYQNFTLGISYDINVSSLRLASNGRGGPEISLIYEAPLPTKRRRRSLPCPRFDR
ncbi:MAG: type IX secretion system membrane protein PorP/SprF [Cytophagales bacterium]|nr:type IX secretion system membrane protein PorP/SprF [Cytophagales bacterium]